MQVWQGIDKMQEEMVKNLFLETEYTVTNSTAYRLVNLSQLV
jgi:hypothetical protein